MTYKQAYDCLPEPYSSQAMSNLDFASLLDNVYSINVAIASGFSWTNSPQGMRYWHDVAERARDGEFDPKPKSEPYPYTSLHDALKQPNPIVSIKLPEDEPWVELDNPNIPLSFPQTQALLKGKCIMVSQDGETWARDEFKTITQAQNYYLEEYVLT